MPGRLDGKVALVTGASSGIGEATALALAAEGVRVAIVRGKATGTPTGKCWGAKPTGKSFETMAIDIFTVKMASWHPPIVSRTG